MNYTEHYHPNSQVSDEEMNNLYTVLDDEQAAIIAHIRLVGKRNSHRMPVNQHPADIAAALDAAKAENRVRLVEKFQHETMIEDSLQSWRDWSTLNGMSDRAENYATAKNAHRIAAVVLARQIVAHL